MKAKFIIKANLIAPLLIICLLTGLASCAGDGSQGTDSVSGDETLTDETKTTPEQQLQSLLTLSQKFNDSLAQALPTLDSATPDLNKFKTAYGELSGNDQSPKLEQVVDQLANQLNLPSEIKLS